MPFIKDNIIHLFESLLEFGEVRAKEIFLVGGSVRDLLIGREPEDWDFIVEGDGIHFARDFAEKSGGHFIILENKVDESRVVIKKGVDSQDKKEIESVSDDKNILRNTFESGNGTSPPETVFDFIGLRENSLEDELERRDFTINAIAISLKDFLNILKEGEEGVSNSFFREDSSSLFLDPFNGRRDLKKKRINLIRDDGFKKDPIRILRAFRFACEYGFHIGEETLEKISASKSLLKRMPPERMRFEIFSISATVNSYPVLLEMGDRGVLSEIMPELEEMKGLPQGKGGGMDLWDHAFRSYEEVEKLVNDFSGIKPLTNRKAGIQFALNLDREILEEIQLYFNSRSNKAALLKIAALLHDIGKPKTFSRNKNGEVHFYGHDRAGADIVERLGKECLRMSNREIGTLKSCVLHHMWPHLLAEEPSITSKAVRHFLREGGDDAVGILILAYGDGIASISHEGDTSRIKNLGQLILKILSARIEERKSPFKRVINGDDLINRLGMKPGPQMGEILKRIEEEQQDGRIKNSEEALALAREWMHKHSSSNQ
jgi:poly(A) polymerase